MIRNLGLCIFVVCVAIAIPVCVAGQGTAGIAADSVALDPSTPKEVADSVSNLINATRTGSWITIAGGVIWLLLNLFRLPQLGSITTKIPARWRLVIAVVLGGVAGILSGIAGGIPWYEAIAVGLFSGPTAVFAHEAVVNTIIGAREKDKVKDPA